MRRKSVNFFKVYLSLAGPKSCLPNYEHKIFFGILLLDILLGGELENK